MNVKATLPLTRFTHPEAKVRILKEVYAKQELSNIPTVIRPERFNR